MRIVILTFDGFNELDSLVAYNILNRVKLPGWNVVIAAPTARVRSMNNLVIDAHAPVEAARFADAVVVGSGNRTLEHMEDAALMASLSLRPSHQLVAAQCSGALMLARLGLLTGVPACTDLSTRPWLEKVGVQVLDRPFHASGNLATAGGCLASQYLAGWLMARLASITLAADALRYVAPVGEKEEYLARVLDNVLPYLPPRAA